MDEIKKEFPNDWPRAFLCWLYLSAHAVESPTKNPCRISKNQIMADLHIKAKTLETYLVLFSNWFPSQNQSRTNPTADVLEFNGRQIAKENQSRTNAENRRKTKKKRNAVPKGRPKDGQRTRKRTNKPTKQKGSTCAGAEKDLSLLSKREKEEKKIDPEKTVDLSPGQNDLQFSGSDATPTKAKPKAGTGTFQNEGDRSGREFNAVEAKRLQKEKAK